MAPLSTFPSYFSVANSPLHHHPPDAARTTILDRPNTVLLHRDRDVARRCAAMVDLILAAISTRIGLVNYRVPDPQRFTERAPDRSLHDLGLLRREDGRVEEDDEEARLGIRDVGEVRAIAATAAMTEVGAGAEDEATVEEGVEALW